MRPSLAAALFAVALAPAALAQTPQGTGFTYQGQLTEAGALASGAYDLQFVLYDAPAGGNPVGPLVALEDVTVEAGLFTVRLDFGSVFTGEGRFLELGVRPGADNGPYTPILPRQELTADPSALFSASAGDSAELGGVPASQYVQTQDPRLSDAREPLPGSLEYVQNTSVPQPGVSFSVGGTGSASILDAAAQFNLGGSRILGAAGAGNLFAGIGSGAANSDGSFNAMFGSNAGQTNTGGSNAFFGAQAGTFNTAGDSNTFVGAGAGFTATIGSENTFVGVSATVDAFDASSGNTLLGAFARVLPNLANATAIGTHARAAASNSLILGGIQGVNGGTSTNVGIGTEAPNARLHIVDSGNIVLGGSAGCPGFAGLAFTSSINANCQNFSIYGGDFNTHVNRVSGGSIFFKENNVTQVSIRPGGLLNLQFLGGGGATALCRNALNDVSTCSSSLRYKADVAPFRGGLELVERLRPIRFTWKANGQPDIGLAAEEVAEVDPLLAFRNAHGEIEGVNYPQLTVVLVNALMQQQREIEALQAVSPCSVSGP